ncbi:ribbon-helix-helix protein, CopG family (plasmid) [Rhizobium sp. CB3171]|uniref:ribbon-helix-helix protein, CopG family n=1 Tax=Rhizobium sp. CB3171 TaxID=3039157 RepID=UPI0024B238F8|nr:ribbon-helix-helix protein, CopG family [Rhizobium sp. CB3171]WFU07133.1 ribbon-helix-helix protein, CopG family [Rhizobium sp. CB3171]
MTDWKQNEERPPSDMAGQLEYAADRIRDASRADLQIMLRRAALVIRNATPIGLDADTDDALVSIAGELGMTRNDIIRHIIKEWLETNAYLPVRELDEDGDVEGTA